MENIIVFTKNIFFRESFLSPIEFCHATKSYKKAVVIDNVIQLRVLASVVSQATFIIDDFSDARTKISNEIMHLRKRGRGNNYIVLSCNKHACFYIGLNQPIITKEFTRSHLVYLLNIKTRGSLTYSEGSDYFFGGGDLIKNELSMILSSKDIFLLDSMKFGNQLTPNSESKIKAIKRLYQIRSQIGLKSQIELNMLLSMMRRINRNNMDMIQNEKK